VTRAVWLAALAAAPALAGCSGVPAMVIGGLGSAGSVYTALDKITEATEPYIAKACDEYQKGKATADATIAAGVVASTAAGKVTSIEIFGDTACANPPAGDLLSTAIWLGQLAGQITTLTTPGR
jgi:hypothetical protein